MTMDSCGYSSPYLSVSYTNGTLSPRALRVPHAEQRMYIVRVNQLVMNALTPSIPIRTAAFRRKSFNLNGSPLLWTDKTARVHTRLKRPVKHSPR